MIHQGFEDKCGFRSRIFLPEDRFASDRRNVLTNEKRVERRTTDTVKLISQRSYQITQNVEDNSLIILKRKLARSQIHPEEFEKIQRLIRS
jgi:hypothetical protein